MKQQHSLVLLLLFTGLAANTQATDVHATEPGLYQWYGERSLGFNQSTGNSSVENLLGKLRFQRDGRQWDSDIKLEAIVSSSDGRKTRQTTTMEAQAGYRFSPHSYSFTNIRYVDDRFGAFSSQASLSTGVGWKPFQGERRKLALEGGVGLRHSEQQISEQQDSELVMRGKMDWQYQLTETTQLIKNLQVESGQENTQVEAETALRLKISAGLGLKLSYRLRNSSQAPEGISGTDTLTALSLDMAF